jgi:hypothetical protein
MKNNSMSLSFGYLTLKSHRRDDGINELHELDLFEVSIVPGPANADTRVVSMKSVDGEYDRVRREMRDTILRHMGGTHNQEKKLTAASLREKADAVAREHAPIQIAEFPC